MADIQTPANLAPFQVLFDESERNPALPDSLIRFAGNLGFPQPLAERPWIYSNFVQSLDGMVTFGGKHPEGRWIAQSQHDRWMMDLLRAHADAVLYGSGSLIQETLYSGIPGGPIFRIADGDLLRLRAERLGRGRQKNIVLTGSGQLRVSEYRLFQPEAKEKGVDVWIVTTRRGAERLEANADTPVLVFGERELVDLRALLQFLRAELDVRYLLCEGGPTLYGSMLREGFIDEKFVTIAPQEIGPVITETDITKTGQEQLGMKSGASSWNRLTTVAGVSFSIETAPWYRWMSSRKAGSHEFNRYRALPPGSHQQTNSAGITLS